MGDVGQDIRDAYIEVGVKYSVLHGAGSGEILTSGEYLLAEDNSQITKPFIREFFTEVSMPFDTLASTGDIITFDDGRRFILMNKTADYLENEAIMQAGVLYSVNVSGELKRLAKTRDAQYRLSDTWNTVQSPAYGLFTPSLFGTGLQEEDFGEISLLKNELYMPSYYGAKLQDRYVVSSGEYYRITGIKKRLFPGVDFVSLEEDTRE